MEKLSPLAEAQDDLEIVSIGALYRGHWEKKYWSSSRVRLFLSLLFISLDQYYITNLSAIWYLLLLFFFTSLLEFGFCRRLRIGTRIQWVIVPYGTTLGPDAKWRLEKDRKVLYFWFDPIYISNFSILLHFISRFILHSCLNCRNGRAQLTFGDNFPSSYFPLVLC